MSALAVQISERLASGLAARAVWLFGSAARGEESADSDLDFLVVVDHWDEPRYRRAQKAARLLQDILVPKDVIVMTADEWEREIEVVCSLASTVRREGVLLYERRNR